MYFLRAWAFIAGVGIDGLRALERLVSVLYSRYTCILYLRDRILIHPRFYKLPLVLVIWFINWLGSFIVA